jgi:hypothetical protein
MAILKENFAASVAAITISLASLGSNSWRQSAFVDNTAGAPAIDYLDAWVQVNVKTGATAAGQVVLWLYGSIDGGVTYSDGASGSDAAYTPTDTPQIFLGRIQTPTATTSYHSSLFSVQQAFGGNVPPRWGLLVQNTNGGALDATAGNFLEQYLGLQYQSV